VKLEELLSEFNALSNPERAKSSAWFFKTGPGQYGEGDQFVGISVPQQRALAKKYWQLAPSDIKKLLHSKVHEHRLTALFILVLQYQKTKDDKEKERIVNFYLDNKSQVNNWDLVDSSASYILGDYLLTRPRDELYKLAKSDSLWDRRIAIIATAAFIKKEQFDDTLAIAQFLLKDSHDLIHKAVGWMLREVGQKDVDVLKKFLDKNKDLMPRTMLRYAIEKFSEVERKSYLSKS